MNTPIIDNDPIGFFEKLEARLYTVGQTVTTTFEYSRHNWLTQKGIVLAAEKSLIGTAVTLTVQYEGDAQPTRIQAHKVDNCKFWR